MKVTVDSIEIPLKYIPGKIKEGDILNLIFEQSKQDANKAKERVSNLLDKLKNKDK